mgnify:FL=1
MKLAVVTFTTGDRPEFLEKCRDSVSKNLPKNSTHHIIKTRGLHCFAKARTDALSLGDYYAIVDDDDIVVNDSIGKCFEAIQRNDTGISFSDEALVDLDGNILSVRESIRTYEEVKKHPWRIHHLVVIRVDAIKHDVTQLYGRIQGIQTWLAESAMSNKGAIHVPIIGYHWTQHTDNMSKLGGRIRLPSIHCNFSGVIPQYTP